MSTIRTWTLLVSLTLTAPAACKSPSRDTSPGAAQASQPAAQAGQPAALAQGGTGPAFAQPPPGNAQQAGAAGWKMAVKPKALSAQVEKGLSWLVAHQLPSGGWGQGDESAQMGQGMAGMRDTANVADTAMAVLALMRAGSTAAEGTYREPIRRGIEYILSEIEASDEQSLFVTSIRGTRVQGKIGTYVDTFNSLIVLTEAKGKMASKAENARLAAALDKVLRKIERNQRQDGTWDNQGWAPVLTQSMAAKGLNRAAQAGEAVDEDTLRKVETQARTQFDSSSGSFAGAGSAGVDLYAGAASTGSLRDSVTTRKTKERKLRQDLAKAATPAEREVAQQQLAENERAEQATLAAEQSLLARLDDPAFIQGFGNNGGEEFLSYMLVSEAMPARFPTSATSTRRSECSARPTCPATSPATTRTRASRCAASASRTTAAWTPSRASCWRPRSGSRWPRAASRPARPATRCARTWPGSCSRSTATWRRSWASRSR